MTNINLLPWRKSILEKKKRQFGFNLLGASVFACVVVLFTHHYLNQRVQQQEARNTQQEYEILQANKLDKLRKKRLSRMRVVNALQSKREDMSHFLKSLIDIIPLNVVLTQIERHGNNITLMGISESVSQISLLIHNIAHADWIGSFELPEIKRRGVENEFKLKLMLRESEAQTLISEKARIHFQQYPRTKSRMDPRLRGEDKW